jgi:hypothetical protein
LREQRRGAAVLHRDGFHDRRAERGLQLVDVDADAALLRDIHHVECDQHRPAEALDLEREAQVQAKVGRVEYADDEVGWRLADIVAGTDVARDDFVGAGRVEAVRAGQVEHAHAAAGRRFEPAFLAFDGHARVVRDLLAAAGEAIEQRGLAAVRIADEGDVQRGCGGVHADAPSSTMRAASGRRSAKRVKPICTRIGSRPTGPVATTRTGSPATKPSSRRRRATASSGCASSTCPTTAD